MNLHVGALEFKRAQGVGGVSKFIRDNVEGWAIGDKWFCDVGGVKEFTWTRDV